MVQEVKFINTTCTCVNVCKPMNDRMIDQTNFNTCVTVQAILLFVTQDGVRDEQAEG